MKKILIIGNSLSAWSVASAFVNKKVNITIIGDKNKIFGAQQLSPNGFKSLKKLTENNDVKKIVHEIIKFEINSYNNNKTRNLKNLIQVFFVLIIIVFYHLILHEKLVFWLF